MFAERDSGKVQLRKKTLKHLYRLQLANCYDQFQSFLPCPMVLSAPQLQNLTLHILLEKTADGRSRATILELSDCAIEAPTDEQAIEQLQQVMTERLTQARVMPITIPLSQPSPAKNSWMKYAGVFKDDPDFADIAESLRAERRDQGDEAAE